MVCRTNLMLGSPFVVDTDYLLPDPHITICLVLFRGSQVSQNSTRQAVLLGPRRRQSVEICGRRARSPLLGLSMVIVYRYEYSLGLGILQCNFDCSPE